MNNLLIVNADTDSIMVTKPNGVPWSKQEREIFLNELNKQFPETIRWEDDGYFSKVIVLKSKNYVLLEEGKDKPKIKGSALKDQKKEKMLLQFIGDVINLLLDDKREPELIALYNSYIKQCYNVKSIAPWCKKATITSKILKCKGHEKLSPLHKQQRGIRKNETSVYDALKGKMVQEGDKIYVFYDKEGNLVLDEHFTGEYNELKLVEKLYSTLKTFKNIIDIEQFPKYHLKKNGTLLKELTGV